MDIPRGDTQPDLSFYEEEEEEERDGKLCCLAGCLTGASAVFLFIVVVPAGILLIIYSQNIRSDAILSIGILLVILPLLSALTAAGTLFARRQILQRIRAHRKPLPRLPTETESENQKF